jgi:hypothetical protein
MGVRRRRARRVLRADLHGERIDSDGGNSALQGWDLVHGHLLLHGWHFGDATFYFFELIVNGIMQSLFGMGELAVHLASALTYLIVAACAVAVAVMNSHGSSRAVRCAVVVAILAAPLLYTPNVWVLLEEPDHIGTSIFVLVSCLLIDRVPDRWFTAPPICVILCAGQLSDLTIRRGCLRATPGGAPHHDGALRRVHHGSPEGQTLPATAVATARVGNLAEHPPLVRSCRRTGQQGGQHGAAFGSAGCCPPPRSSRCCRWPVRPRDRR